MESIGFVFTVLRLRPAKRNLPACALVATICACTTPPTSGHGSRQAFVYEKRIGLAKWGADRGCLSVFDSSIPAQTKIALVDQPASSDPPSVREAKVVDRLSTACDADLSSANSAGVTPSFYTVATTDGATPAGVVIAILDPPSPIVVREGRVEADLDGDGVKESFRACTSTETVHLMVWTGSPAQGRPRWRGYYSVAYDMVPSCTDQDVAGMVALDKERSAAK